MAKQSRTFSQTTLDSRPKKPRSNYVTFLHLLKGKRRTYIRSVVRKSSMMNSNGQQQQRDAGEIHSGSERQEASNTSATGPKAMNGIRRR